VSNDAIFRPGGIVYDSTGGQPINVVTAENLLKPPPIPGYKDSSASEDIFGFLKGLVVPVSSRKDKASYLQSLKTSDPTNYKKYEDAMQKYNDRKTRIGLTSSSPMDMSIHKDVVQDAFEYYRQALNRAAKSKGELSNQEIETIYDVSSTLESVLNGTSSITYDQFSNINRALMSELPPQFLGGQGAMKLSDSISSLTGDTASGTATLVSNDVKSKVSSFASGSGNDANAEVTTDVDVDAGIDFETPVFDEDGNEVKQKRGDEEDPKEEDPKDPVKPPVDSVITKVLKSEKSNYSTYKPRFKTGNTDELLGRDVEEVQMADKIIDALSVETEGWGNGASNSLYKANILQDRLRYERTIAMPSPAPQPNRTISQQFINRGQPIFQPVQVEALRSFKSHGHNPYNSYQYTGFHPSVMETPFYGTEIRRMPQENPYVHYILEEEHQAQIPNYFQNLRWV
jgi:hypothetical protein